MAIRFIDEGTPVSSAKPKSSIRFIDDAPIEQKRPSLWDMIGLAGEIAPSPVARVQKGLDYLGEKSAEFGGRMGAPGTGAAVGTAISMAPELLSAGTTLGAIQKSPSTLARAIRTTPKEFNAEFRAGEKAAGITERVPELRGAMARFPQPERIVPTKQPIPIAKPEMIPSVPPVSYPRDPATFLNFANARIQAFGKRLSAKEIDDYRQVLTNEMDKMAAKGMGGTPLFAKAADLKTKVTGLMTEVVPGRGDLNKAYALSQKLRATNLKKSAWESAKKYGKKALGGAVVGGAGAYAAKKVFQP